jgi:hypothetical protein
MLSQAAFKERCCCESEPHPTFVLYLSACPDDCQLELIMMLSLVYEQRLSLGKR